MLKDLMNAGGMLETVDLGLLQIDATYQRREMQHHKRIAKEFDARACDPLKVAHRKDGTLWIIDGQQRRKALQVLGYTHWRALVIESTGTQMEAHLFQVFGGGKNTVKALNVYDVFKAQLASHDPVAVAMQSVANKHGLEFITGGTRNTRYPYLSCIKHGYQLVKNHGTAPLDKALAVTQLAWPQAEYSTSTMIVVGLTLFWMYFPEADQKRLVDRSKGQPALYYHQLGQDGLRGAGSNKGQFKKIMLELFVEKYNKGLRNRLQIADRLADMTIPEAS